MTQTPLDFPDKENPKLVRIFNEQLLENQGDYKKDESNCIGCLETATEQVGRFYGTLTCIETYTRYGLNSDRNQNGVEIKLTFANGRVVNEIYTGKRWNGKPLMDAPLLFKAVMKNGQALQVFTNGMEMNKTPENAGLALAEYIKSAINFDIKENRDLYFPAPQSENDIKRQWDSL